MSPAPFRFGEFELDVAAGDLRKRGVRIRLRDQAVGVLTMLLENPGRLVSREDLRRRLWPDNVFVDFDNNLNTAIARLREALGDSADQPRFIETVPKRGYRFVAQVAAPGSGPAPARPRLLVLPLVNLSNDPSQDYISYAMTEEIITALASLASTRLAVIARTTTMVYKDTAKDVSTIGNELAVHYLVEGSVRLAAGGIVLNLQLIRVSDQSHIWARHYEAKAEDVFQVQRDAARAIVECIIGRPNGVRETVREPTDNLAAHNLFMQGRYELNKFTPDGLALAKQYLEKAIEQDPNFALACDSLAELYWYAGFFGFAPPKEACSAGIFLALRAVEIDPTLGETHALIGLYRKELDYNWPEVRRQMKLAIKLSPASPVVRLRYALAMSADGSVAQAADEIESALESDPLSLFMRWWLTVMRWLARQQDKALEQARLVLRMDPNFHIGYLTLSGVLTELGRFEEAVESQRKATEGSGNSPLMLGWLARYLAAAGKRDEARAIVEDLERLATHSYVPPLGVAAAHIALGNVDSCVGWLNRAVDARDPFIVPIKTYPFLDSIRSDPRYLAILERMNLQP